MASVGVVYDQRMCAHENPHGSHPEQPARITSIWRALEESGVLERCVRVPAREATTEELSAVHMEHHIKTMLAVSKRFYGKEGRAALARRYNSIYFNEGSSSSALLAAGSVIEISMRVARGELRSGAAVVRPPGHHAEADKAMGFCLFNNVAIAAHILAHGEEPRKILIVDWDVHHGNGTQDMFWEDPNVLYFSVHRYDGGAFYPCSSAGNYDKVGEARGAGFNINVPWPHGGFGDGDYLAVWDQVLLPVAYEFNPDLVLISAGFDSAQGDPLGRCNVTPRGYSVMTEKLMELAGGKVVLALEGGYNLHSIADSYLACVQTLLGDLKTEAHEIIIQQSFEETWSVIQSVRSELCRYWPCLSGNVVRPSKVISSDQEVLVNESSEEEADAIAEEENVTTAELSKLLNDMALENAEVEISTVRSKSSRPHASVVNRELKNTYVWYATFGSNLCYKRLMCYIEGGKAEGGKRVVKGLRDKTPPVEDTWMSAPHRLFFGRASNATWGPGGVAFLDPTPSKDNNETSSSYIRAYKITLEQFNGILAGENHLREDSTSILLEDLEALKWKDAYRCVDALKGVWYGSVLYLTEKDGLPVVTITCSKDDVERYKSGDLPVVPPGDPYRAIIVKGLLERGDLDESAAEEYVASRI